MDPILEDLAAKIFLGIVIAVSSSWVTVKLSFKKTKNEVLWQKKLEAYTRILEALHVLRIHAARAVEQEHRGISYGKSQEALEERLASAYSDIHKIIDVGTLIVSPDVAVYLQKHLKLRWEDWESQSISQFYEEEEIIMGNALKQVKEIALLDLAR